MTRIYYDFRIPLRYCPFNLVRTWLKWKKMSLTMVPTHDLLHWRQECNTVTITPQMWLLFLWYLLIWVAGETGVHIRPRLQSVQIIIDRCKMQGIRFQSMKIGELIAIAEKKKDEVVSMQSFSKQLVFTIWLISTVIIRYEECGVL